MGLLRRVAYARSLNSGRWAVYAFAEAWAVVVIMCMYLPKVMPTKVQQVVEKTVPPNMLQTVTLAVGMQAILLTLAGSIKVWSWWGRRVKGAPGTLLVKLSDFLVPARVHREVLAPTVADMQLEYNEALQQGRKAKARWVRIRGTCAFVQALLLCTGVNFGKHVLQIWKLL